MADFINEMDKIFSGNSHFDYYFRCIEPDQDGSYMVFGAFGELLKDILIGKIEDNELFLKQCEFINLVASEEDPEWNNVLKSELFSILDNKELKKLHYFLSDQARKQLELYLI